VIAKLNPPLDMAFDGQVFASVQLTLDDN